MACRFLRRAAQAPSWVLGHSRPTQSAKLVDNTGQIWNLFSFLLSAGTTSIILDFGHFEETGGSGGLMRNQPFLRFILLKENLPAPLPAVIIPVLAPFVPLFSPRVWLHTQLLLLGAIRAPGDRTVMAALLVMGLARERRLTNCQPKPFIFKGFSGPGSVTSSGDLYNRLDSLCSSETAKMKAHDES